MGELVVAFVQEVHLSANVMEISLMVGCNGSLGLGAWRHGTISSHERTTSGHPEPEREALTLVEMKGRKIGKQLASPNGLSRLEKA